MPQRLYRFVLPLAALLAVAPLLVHGPSCGHDFDFHLLSWLEAATQYIHGGYPHWAYTPAWNAGEPRFVFYPPISWTLGALLTLVLPIQVAPIAFTWIALTLSGFTAHTLVRRYAAPNTALLAAAVYLLNPYILFTAYERTAYAELLAAAWLPLLFAAALAPRTRILRIAIPLALLWLTNAPAAVMGTYALALITAVRLALSLTSSQRLRPAETSPPLHLALLTTAATALGLALATFYILPAAYERRFVQISMLTTTGMRPTDHFLFHRMPGTTPDDLFHNAVVRSASIVSLLLLAALAIAFILAVRKLNRVFSPRPVAGSETWASAPGWYRARLQHLPEPLINLLPLVVLTILIAFLLTPPSLFLWNHVPQLSYLQFPWRLDALLAVILSLAPAIALPPLLKPRTTLIALAASALLLIAPAYRAFAQPCDEDDAPQARAALFHSPLGTDATDEYTPSDADPDALEPNNPPYWIILITPAAAAATVNTDASHMPMPGPAPNHFSVYIPQFSYLVLNRRAYPGWVIRVDGHVTVPDRERTDGLIVLRLPRGDHRIDLRFGHSWDRTDGLAISLTALAVAAGIFLSDRKRRLPA